jgi:hypothetical protein
MRRLTLRRSRRDRDRTLAALAEVRPLPVHPPPASSSSAGRLLTFIGGPPLPRRLDADQ